MRLILMICCLFLGFTTEKTSYAQSNQTESKKFSAGIEVSALGLFAGNF